MPLVWRHCDGQGDFDGTARAGVLRKDLGFALVAFCSLALGIGVTPATFIVRGHQGQFDLALYLNLTASE